MGAEHSRIPPRTPARTPRTPPRNTFFNPTPPIHCFLRRLGSGDPSFVCLDAPPQISPKYMKINVMSNNGTILCGRARRKSWTANNSPDGRATAAEQPRNTRGTIEHAKHHPELSRNQFGANLQKMLSGTIACTMQISAYYI